MENPFKTILANEELPDAIKKKVMDDVALVKLSLEVADLLSVKYPSAIGNFLGIGKKITTNEQKNKEKED